MNPACHPAPRGGRTAAEETFVKESFRPAPREEKQDTPKSDLTHPADIAQTYPGTNVDDFEGDSGMTSLKEQCLMLRDAGVNIGAQNETLEIKDLKNQKILLNSRSNTVVCVCGVGQRAICKDKVGEIIVDSNRSVQGEYKKHNTEQSRKKNSSMIKDRKYKRQEKKDSKMEEKYEYLKQTMVKEKYLQSEEARGEVEKQDAEKSETCSGEKQTEIVRTMTATDAKPQSSLVMMWRKAGDEAEQKLSDKAFIIHKLLKADKKQIVLKDNRCGDTASVDEQKFKVPKKKLSITEGTSKDKNAINQKESQPEEKEVDVCEGELCDQAPGDYNVMETGEQEHCPHVHICTSPKHNNNNNNNICTSPKHNKDVQNKARMSASGQKQMFCNNNNSNNNNNNNSSNNNSDLLNTLYRNLTRRCAADKRMLLVYEIVLQQPDVIQIAYKLEDGPAHLLTPSAAQAGGKMEKEDMSKGQLDLLENEKETKRSKVKRPKVKRPKVKRPKVKRPKVTVSEGAFTVKRRRSSKRRSGRRRHSRHGRRRTRKKNKRRRSYYKKASRDQIETREAPVDSGRRGPSNAWGSGDTGGGKDGGSGDGEGGREEPREERAETNGQEPTTDSILPKCQESRAPRSPQSNNPPPGGTSGTGAPPAYVPGDQPPHHSNSPPSSTRPTRRRSQTSRHCAAIAQTTPYPDHPSSPPGSRQTARVRRRLCSGDPVWDSESGGGGGQSVGRGCPCSNSPPSGNTGAIGGGPRQQNGLSDNGEGDKEKDASSGSRRGSEQSQNDGSQKGGEGDKEEDSGRNGGRGEKGGGGGGGSGDGDRRDGDRREEPREEIVEINGPSSTPLPWPPPDEEGAGVGPAGGGGARPPGGGGARPPGGGGARPAGGGGARPAGGGGAGPVGGGGARPRDVCDAGTMGGGGARPKVYTEKELGRDHCQGPYKEHYLRLRRKRVRAGASREEVNRACSELEKCLVKCLHLDKDKQCAACGLLHAALKHVAKCPTGFWTECKDCWPVADILIYHVEGCLAHTYAAPAGAASADQGRLCRNNLKLCHNLVYRIKDRCARATPREQTGHTFTHAIEEVWTTPGVWTRIKNYLRKVFGISLALNDSPPEALQSGFGDQLVSVPNFFSVRIASIRDAQLSILSSVALQQIIAAGSETVDPSEAVHEYHSGYSSSHEWELRALPSDNVKYGNQVDLIAIGERWRELKESRRRPGFCTKHYREEDETEQGVILAHHARHLKVQYPGGRYKRGDQWELGPVLGAGMSGRCSLALDSNTGFKFCVKEVILDKFELTEMEILTRLRHPGICLCYGAVLIGDSIYMFMEYVEGCSLQSHIGGLTRLNDMTALVYFKQMTEVLQYLQGQGVLHEDIKSENILLRSGTTRLVLIDFGLARHVAPAYPQVAANEPPVGSQTQWSPEKAECRGYGFPSDMWAAACVLLEMVTGSPPWLKRYSQAASLIYVIPMNAPPLADIHDYVSQTMRELIVWLWTMDPEQRPAPLDVLGHRAFSMIDNNIISRVIKNRSILTSGSPSPINVQDESSVGRNNTVSIGSTAHSGEVHPIERQSSSSSSGSSNDAPRCPSSLMSLVEDVKTVSTPRDPTHRACGGQSVGTTSSMPDSGQSVVDSGGSVPLEGSDRLKYQLQGQAGAASAPTHSHTAGSLNDASHTTPHGSNPATPTHSRCGSDVNVRVPFTPVTAITPVLYTATSCILTEPTIPNLSIFDQPNDSLQSSGSSVDLAKLMREADGYAAAGSDDEFNDIQINSSPSSRPDMGVVIQGSNPRAPPDTSGLYVEEDRRDRRSSGQQSQSDSDIQSEYRDLQNGLFTRAASDHPSMLEDDWEDLREETEAVYDDAPHDSMTLSQNPPAAPAAAAPDPPAEVEADGVLVVFMDHKTREPLCHLRMYHIAEWDKVVRTASSRIQPRFQDGYCVCLAGEPILDLSTSLSMNVPLIELEVWDYTGEEDWYVKNYQIMYSPHYMGAFMPQ